MKIQFSDKKTLIRKAIIWGIGIIAGLIAGYIYYIRIGCNSGSCPITSNPYITMLYGALVGFFIADFFVPKKKKVQE